MQILGLKCKYNKAIHNMLENLLYSKEKMLMKEKIMQFLLTIGRLQEHVPKDKKPYAQLQQKIKWDAVCSQQLEEI